MDDPRLNVSLERRTPVDVPRRMVDVDVPEGRVYVPVRRVELETPERVTPVLLRRTLALRVPTKRRTDEVPLLLRRTAELRRRIPP